MADCQCMDKVKYPEYWRVCPYAAKPTPKPCKHHYVKVGTIPIATVVYECLDCGDYYEKDVS